ncbi:hypothetical protein AMS68_000093 [Peltaster fructicola]|uniref:Uncharacterized protein n=1 Tax=Peltaster fructicola TaxID=286661 RepID=A0A6H0XIN1_9PEZI|nr:hypothetical protein AMS68_000093 [Peltaster fructicola]
MSGAQPYWPQGWSRDRLVNASGDELGTIPPEESDRMFDSLRAALGTEGYKALVKEISDNEEERERQEAATTGQSANFLDQFSPEDRVPLLRSLRQWCPEGPYGWVVYRSCCYDDELKWRQFRNKFDQCIDSSFEPHIDVPGIREVKERFEVRWVEEKLLDVDSIAAHYRELEPTLPQGLRQAMCLSIGDAELQSVLDSPIPTPNPVHEQLLIPYVLGIDMMAGENAVNDEFDAQEHGWRTSYRVAVSALTRSLLINMLDTSMSPRELSVGVSENKIWLDDSGRYGIFTMGVSQSD